MRTAVGMTIRLTADDTLPDRVASAWTWSGLVGDRDGSSVALGDEGLGPGPGSGSGPGLGFGFGPADGPGRPAVDLTLRPPPARAGDDDVALFCAEAAFAVSARACLADRAYPTDAAFADASIRAACACLRAPFAFLASLEDARAEPSAAAALVRLATLAPSASLAPSLLTLVATRLNESPTLRVRAASTASAYVSRFARRFHESYRGFRRRADPRRIAAMDPDAIRPAFLGVFRATIGFAHVAPMTTARDVVAAAEAAAAVNRAAPGSGYAPALQRIAAALRADHPVARDARLAFVAEAFPDERELDAPVVGTGTGTTTGTGTGPMMGTGTTTGSGSGRVDGASKNYVGVAWRDDDVFGTRLHLLLRLFPFAAPEPVPVGGGGSGDRPEDETSRRRFIRAGPDPSALALALARDASGASVRGAPSRGDRSRGACRARRRVSIAPETHEFGSSRTSTRRWNGSRGALPGNRSSRRWERWRGEGLRESTRRRARDASCDARRRSTPSRASRVRTRPARAARRPRPRRASRRARGSARARRRRRFVDCVRSRRARRSRARAGTPRRVRGGGDGRRGARVRIPVGAIRGVRGPGGRVLAIGDTRANRTRCDGRSDCARGYDATRFSSITSIGFRTSRRWMSSRSPGHGYWVSIVVASPSRVPPSRRPSVTPATSSTVAQSRAGAGRPFS